jgi:hypothetical protein
MPFPRPLPPGGVTFLGFDGGKRLREYLNGLVLPFGAGTLHGCGDCVQRPVRVPILVRQRGEAIPPEPLTEIHEGSFPLNGSHTAGQRRAIGGPLPGFSFFLRAGGDGPG